MNSKNFRKDYVITASEIAQYQFCPISWYLQRCGFKPVSESLAIGKEKHAELGKIISYTDKSIRKAGLLALLGYLLLIVSILLLILKVIF